MRIIRTGVFAAWICLAPLLFGASAAPVANADDPLAPIRTAVNRDRSGTGCPRYTYNGTLEAEAQARVRGEAPPGGYNGMTEHFFGFGDPQAAAINSAYTGGAAAMISNCRFTEFGVGFIRPADREYDVVTIVFGAPADPTPTRKPTPTADPTLVPTPAVQVCPTGSPTPTVPAFGTCAPPKDAVKVSVAKGPQWTVNVMNTAAIAGKCTFTANGLGGGLSNRSFDLAANGSASVPIGTPLPFVTYHVVTSCHGTFDGKDVEFGHDEQDVTL